MEAAKRIVVTPVTIVLFPKATSETFTTLSVYELANDCPQMLFGKFLRGSMRKTKFVFQSVLAHLQTNRTLCMLCLWT